MKEVINGVVETLNPKGGNGVKETLILVIITLTMSYMLINQMEIPPFFSEIFIGISMWLFGRNSKKEGEKNEND